MSGTGRDAGGMSAGTSGSASMGDQGLGSAEVHTGLHSGPGEEYSGLQFAGTESQGGRLRGAAGAVRERVGELGGQARNAASTARERVSSVRQRANSTLESRGVLDRLRDNPLPVLGVAFALGFVLAGNEGDDDDDRPLTRATRARRELRSALMAGLSAGIAQGARGFLNQAGSQGGGFVNGLLENLMGSVGGEGGSSYGSGSTGGTTGRAGSTAGRSGSYSGGGTGSRPPSHQEY